MTTEKLIERLNADIVKQPPDWALWPYPLLREAATALTSQSSELLSLRRKVEETEAERDVQRDLLKEEFRVSADRAEQIMALKRALEPFAALDMPASDKWTCGTFLIEHDDIRRARALAGDRP